MSVFDAASTAMIRAAIDSLTSAPGFTKEQQKARSEAVVCGIMAFLPSDPVQTMLASLAVAQHFALLDTFRALNAGGPDERGLRASSVAQTRVILSLVKELRLVRKDMHAARDSEHASGPAGGEDPAFTAHADRVEEAVSATAETLKAAPALDRATAARAAAQLERGLPPHSPLRTQPPAASSGRDALLNQASWLGFGDQAGQKTSVTRDRSTPLS